MNTIQLEPAAVIGMGCRFPGGASDPDSYWDLLVNGHDAITEIPPDRWTVDAFYEATRGVGGKTYSRWGGFLKDIEGFDPACFGISPREAANMDPQQRLLLEVTWEALADAGVPVDSISGTATGVFFGMSTLDYGRNLSTPADMRMLNAMSGTGCAFSIASNRISYCLNLHGPSFTVDTACSSSIVALDCALRSMWQGQCDMAIVGGVNLIISPEYFIAFSAASMLSSDGRCKAFDASADGFVRAEGAGVIVMKPLSAAQRDRDPIHALVLGSGVNQDGKTGGISLPSAKAQEVLLRDVYSNLGIDPASVHYVEAHGTGTAVGDPAEASALGRVFSIGRTPGRPLIVGSVKTNIGHLEAAAGMASLIKTILNSL